MVLRKKLKLKVSDKRTSEGYVISLEENKDRLEQLKKFYNLAEEAGEQVNVMNVVGGSDELPQQAEIDVSSAGF